MTSPFAPTHDLYIIPMQTLEKELKNWFLTVKKIKCPFTFKCASSESSFGHMGDLYFDVLEEELSEAEMNILLDAYGTWGFVDIGLILQEFFETDDLEFDTHPYDEEVYIRIPK